MSLKQSLENKLTMATYDNPKLQKKAKGLFKSIKDVEKSLNNLTTKK